MNSIARTLVLACFGALYFFTPSVAAQQTTQQQSTALPPEYFAALDNVDRPRLSPDGSKIAYFVSYEGRRSLFIHGLDGSNPMRIPPWDDELDFNSFFWKTDDIIVFKISMTLRRWAFRGETSENRALSFSISKADFKWLGEPKSRQGEHMSQMERIVDHLPSDPDHILLELDFELDATPVVYKVNVRTGRRSRYSGARSGINDWYTDQNSEVRMGTGYRPKSDKFNAVYKNARGKWIDLTDLAWHEKYDIEGFTDDPSFIYVSGITEHGTIGLFKLAVETGEIVETVFSHPNIDILGVYEHPITGRVAGITYVDDYYRIHYIDSDLALLQRSMEKALPGSVVSVVSKAKDANLYLVETRSDRNPGEYFVYNRDQRKLDWILSARPQIDERLMASVQPVMVPVRDGSEIPAYLTVPPAAKAEMLPTVILPHGGPHARDTADWDFWAQFYANRGYLVVQPNFRGSSGYGPHYLWAGRNQWGGLMQDDVTDTTKWVIDQGMADPDRICIAGASYGGYAALMGPIKEPELYKCAISINGVTDLPAMKRHDKKYVGGRAFIKHMGLTGTDDKIVSPDDRAQELTLPVMLIASKDDTTVPYDQSKSLYKKLKKLKREPVYIELKDDNHYLIAARSRLVLLTETEKFLKEHIGQ